MRPTLPSLILSVLVLLVTASSSLAAAPTASRPYPFPQYTVGDTATLIVTTNPVQAHQPVYRWRYRDGMPDGAQPTQIGTTDANGRLQVTATIPASVVGIYANERFAVGSPSASKSNRLHYTIHASSAPIVGRPAPYPNYDVGDTARLEIRTHPAQANQKVYRWRHKNGAPDGSQPTLLGWTDSSGLLVVQGTLGTAEIGDYSGEAFAVGTTGGPRSPAVSYAVHADFAPTVARPAPYPTYRVGDLALMHLSTRPAQPHQSVYRFRYKNGSPDGAQPTEIGATDSSGRLTISGTLGHHEIGTYTYERFAVGSKTGPRSPSRSYTVTEPPPIVAPTVSRTAPYPSYQVGDVESITVSTDPAQPGEPVYRWRTKDGAPDGGQPTVVGTTSPTGRWTSQRSLGVGDIGTYADERFAVGSSSNPRSAALAFTVAEPPPPEPPPGYRPPVVQRTAPYPNYAIGDTDTLLLTTDPPQPHQPVYRFRKHNNLEDGAQPTHVGDTDGDGRYEHHDEWLIGDVGFYSDERFVVGDPGYPTSVASNFNVIDPTRPLVAPEVSRDAPFPSYHVGDIARMVLTTDPIQPNQPVYRWRQKDGADDGAQPTLIGTTNGFGRLAVEVAIPAEVVGSYTGEQFAVGSPDGLRSPALAYTIAPNASGEIVLSSVEPAQFDAGAVTVTTIRGAGLTPQTEITVEADAGTSIDAEVLSVSPDGTEMTVQVDTTGAPDDVNKMAMLIAREGTSSKAQPIRTLREGPVVDVWTPSVPYAGGTFVLSLLGHHLEDVTITSSRPDVFSVQVMTTSDHRVFGLIHVAEHVAPHDWYTLLVHRDGRGTLLPFYVLPARDPAVREQDVLADSSISRQAKAAGQPAPELAMQAVGINPELIRQSLDIEEQASKLGLTFGFSVTWRFVYPIVRETVTFDIDTGEVGEIARALGLGDQLRLGAFTFSLIAELQVHFDWWYNTITGWYGPRICADVLLAAEVPGATQTVSFEGCWGFGGGSGTSPGATTKANILGGDCAEAVTTDIIDGVGYSTITQVDCCEQPLAVHMAGKTFGQTFDEVEPNVAWTTPLPTCQTTPTCAELDLRIDAIDEQFAPSAERLDFAYTIWSEEYGAPTFTKLEIFREGDSTHPIFVHQPLPANVQAESYVGPDGQQGWDGKDLNGSWIHPGQGPFTVRISASETPDYQEACTTETRFDVLVDSVDVTPTGPQNLVKNSIASSEVETLATATVKLKTKDGGGIETEIPIDLEWSFEDPDDSSSRPGVDASPLGDDNAPVDHGGVSIRDGGASTMWESYLGTPTTLIRHDQAAEMTTRTSGTDKGKANIVFRASIIAGDNYIVIAKTRNAGDEVEGRSDIWTVRKKLDFRNAYQMPGGADISVAMASSNVDPIFSADGHTDYTLVGAAQSVVSREYLAPTLPPEDSEKPTDQERLDYASSDPDIRKKAKEAIEKKAQTWYKRNWNSLNDAGRAYIAAASIRGPAVIGARYYHEKLDSDHSGTTGRTTYYPAGIQIKLASNEKILVDPDGDWDRVQGVEIDGNAFVFANITSTARLLRVGRHEAGHASDHESFGTGDHIHSGACVMAPTATSDTFSDEAILHLRGWKD